MSTTTAALESAVALVIENMAPAGQAQTSRQRVNGDRAFAQVLKILAPRIRHFIRQYGLVGHWDDAEQCCAIGVHRAIQAYDPARAQFTTFVNWQLRGELQSLRFRVMTDQRPSAKKVEAVTVSLNAVSFNSDGESNSLESMIEDDEALDRTESAAGEHLTSKTRDALLDAYISQLREVALQQMRRRARNTRSVQVQDPRLPRYRAGAATLDPQELAELEERLEIQRRTVARRLSDDTAEMDTEIDPLERERQRQVAKRAAKTIAEIAAKDPRFGGMFARPAPTSTRRSAKNAADKAAAANGMLVDAAAEHNQLCRVVVAGVEAPISAAPLEPQKSADAEHETALTPDPNAARQH